jgi:glycosyltransferase involved in cell wall biosynthesis
MNVTTSVHWRRPSVGVVRVERALCEELARLYPAGRFRLCIWEGDRFVEWTPPPEETSRPPARTETVTPEAPASVPMLFPVLPRRHALVAIAQGMLSLMPDRVRPLINRLLVAIKPRLVRLILRWQARRAAGATVAVPPSVARAAWDKMPFAAGDVLISVGLDWDHAYYRHFHHLRKHLGVRVVSCCYDLIPVLYPQYCVADVASRFTAYFLDVAEGSELTLCISRQSERDLLALLDRTGGRAVPTHVFPLGDNVPEGNGEVGEAVAAVLAQPFILFVSTIERRKNHEVLYRAYHLLAQAGRCDELPRLVFVGMQGWGVADLLSDMALDPLVRDLIVQLHQVSDAELRRLYEAAMFCVYPSLYEGWGLPVGEALAMGKVVLSSDRGSLPEVGGDLVRYVDPWSPRAWADEIWLLLTDPALLQATAERVAAEYRPRTWAAAAASVRQAIDAFVERPAVAALPSAPAGLVSAERS